MKKMQTFLLMAVAVLIIIFTTNIATTARAEEKISGDFSYEIHGDYVTITKYNGDDAKVVVPATIKGKIVNKIGKKAFYEVDVQIITLPEDLTEIEASAFEKSTLDNIFMSDKVKKIGANTFRNTDLRFITLPDSITEMGKSIFFNCVELETVKLPAGIQTIPEETFHYCYMLRSVEIPETVKIIETNAFNNCEKLSEIKLPAAITEIKDGAFLRCITLTGIDLPKGLLKIGEYAFFNCRGLINIVIPNRVTEIGESAFEGCKSLHNIALPTELTEISAYTFKDCTSFTDVNIPEGIKVIQNGAFYGCTRLQSVTLPDSLEKFNTIGEYTDSFFDIIANQPFGGCPYLNVISVGDNNRYFATKQGILYSKDGLILYFCPPALQITNLNLENVTTISSLAFAEQTSVKSIKMPDTVNYIGAGAFYYTTALKNLTLSKNIRFIDSYTFTGSGVTALSIPEGVGDIGADAFMGCKNMKEISLPASLSVFSNPNEYESTGPFDGCISLEKINVADGNTNFMDKKGILYKTISFKVPSELVVYPSAKKGNSYTLPKNVIINPDAFFQCKYLKKVVIPEGYTDIWCYFYKCKDIEVYLPRSIKNFPPEGHITDFGLFSKCTNCYAMVYKDSKAYKYCKKNNVPYKLRDATK